MISRHQSMYRKKPVVIEAFQMTKERRLSNADWPEWLNRAWNKEKYSEGSVLGRSMKDWCFYLIVGFIATLIVLMGVFWLFIVFLSPLLS